MTENKKLDLLYGALFGCLTLTGCAMLGGRHVALVPDVPGAPGSDGVGATVGILQSIAGLCGQPWAIPIIGAVGGVVGCATNAHHGVRNVARATASGAVRLATMPIGGAAKPKSRSRKA